MTNKKIDLEEIIRNLQKHKDSFKKFKVKSMGLFGSFVRGEQNEDSDIDFFVEFEDPDFDNFMNLTFFLEDLFGRRVEILTPAGIESIRISYIKEEIKRSIIYV